MYLLDRFFNWGRTCFIDACIADYSMFLSIIDESLTNPYHRLKCVLFARELKALPGADVGDVIRFHRLEVNILNTHRFAYPSICSNKTRSTYSNLEWHVQIVFRLSWHILVVYCCTWSANTSREDGERRGGGCVMAVITRMALQHL